MPVILALRGADSKMVLIESEGRVLATLNSFSEKEIFSFLFYQQATFPNHSEFVRRGVPDTRPRS